MFLQSDHMNAAAAASGDWGDYGYAGANIVRDSFTLPNEGEYVFFGDYLGLRTFDDRGGLELVSDDVIIVLDILDFDPVEGVQGAITGTIFNRNFQTADGVTKTGVTNVTLRVIEFNTDDGDFTDGSAVYYAAGSGDEAGSGSYEGFLAGEDASEIGANVVVEGLAYTQVVGFELVTYTVTTPEQVFINPITLAVTTIPETVVTGTYSAANADSRETVQNQVDNGTNVATVSVNPADLPEGAVITGSTIESVDFTSTFDAREVGVIVAAQ